MKIRTKTTLIIAITVIALVFFSQFAVYFVLMDGVKRQETNQAMDMDGRIDSEVSLETNTVNLLAYSWAVWDDTYQFVQDQNQSYMESNFNQLSLASTNVSMMLFLDSAGNDIANIYYDIDSGMAVDFPLGTLEALLNDTALLNHSETTSISGLLALPTGICMVSSWPILHSDETGPSAGTLIFCKYLGTLEMEKISKLVGAPVQVTDLRSPGLTDEQRSATQQLSDGSGTVLVDQNQDAVRIFGTMKDISGTSSILLTTQASRGAYQEGMSAFYTTALAIATFGFIIVLVIYYISEKLYVSRLYRLEGEVNNIGSDDTLSRRIEVSGNDEIHALSEKINEMVDALEKRTQELRESEKLYKSIMDQSVSAIFIADIEGKGILHANPAFKTLFKVSDEDMPRITLGSLLPVNHDISRMIIEKIASEEKVIGIEARLMTTKGENIDVEVAGSVIDYEGKRALCINVWDVTERHRIEAVHDRMEKLEAVGNLAAGIAHDFNNLLTGISGSVSLLKRQLNADPQAIKRLDEAETASMAAKEIAQDLMSLSKGGEPMRRPVDLSQLIKSIIQSRLDIPSIHYDFKIEQDLRMADIDPGQVGRVFSNLLLNARDAMPEGGEISVAMANAEFSENEHYPLRAGRYVVVVVKDEGVGIPPDVLPKIFDPYFTTKKSGYGIGLSVVQATVRRHHGSIEVESTVGKGTVFRLYLPAADVVRSDDISIHSEPVRAIEGHANVLLMDDQDVIVEVASDMLRELGYGVGIARDGVEALEIYGRALAESRRYDVVIMDLTIPQGMGGKEAVKRLLEIDTTARVIVSSGYSNDPIMANYADHGFVGVLPKPFTLEELARVIRQARA